MEIKKCQSKTLVKGCFVSTYCARYNSLLRSFTSSTVSHTRCKVWKISVLSECRYELNKSALTRGVFIVFHHNWRNQTTHLWGRRMMRKWQGRPRKNQSVKPISDMWIQSTVKYGSITWESNSWEKLRRHKARYHTKQANSFSTVNKFSKAWFYQGDVGQFWKYDKWCRYQAR